MTWEIQRIKDLACSPLPPLQTADIPLVYGYLRNVLNGYCAILEAYEAEAEAAEAHNQLLLHDRQFADGDSSKYVNDRARIVRIIRASGERIAFKEREIERCQSIDKETCRAVETFMDDVGIDKDDPLRPSYFLKEPRHWSESELNELDAAIALSLDQIPLQSTDPADMDLRTFLAMVSTEIAQTKRYVSLDKEFGDRLAQLWGEQQTYSYSTRTSSLKHHLSMQLITEAQYVKEMAELNETYFPQTLGDERLQSLACQRAVVIAEIDKIRKIIGERLSLFRSALDTREIPSTSILRKALCGPAPARPTFDGAKQKTRKQDIVDNFIIVLGKWWGRWHEDGQPLPDAAWGDLSRLMEWNNFELEEFLSTKSAIKRHIQNVNSKLPKREKIVSWSSLIDFVRTADGQNSELLRILRKRFSEIYRNQYLPYIENKKQ